MRAIREELLAAQDELQSSREELHVAKDELCVKTTILSLVRQEASEAERSVERLTVECRALRGDFQRQEALANQKDG